MNLSFHFFWDICLGVHLVGHVAVGYLVFKESAKLFFSVYNILHSYKQCICDPVSHHPHQHLVLLFFILAILIGVCLSHCAFNSHFPNIIMLYIILLSVYPLW